MILKIIYFSCDLRSFNELQIVPSRCVKYLKLGLVRSLIDHAIVYHVSQWEHWFTSEQHYWTESCCEFSIGYLIVDNLSSSKLLLRNAQNTGTKTWWEFYHRPVIINHVTNIQHLRQNLPNRWIEIRKNYSFAMGFRS